MKFLLILLFSFLVVQLANAQTFDEAFREAEQQVAFIDQRMVTLKEASSNLFSYRERWQIDSLDNASSNLIFAKDTLLTITRFLPDLVERSFDRAGRDIARRAGHDEPVSLVGHRRSLF